MHYTIRKFDEYMEYRRYSPKTRSSNTKAVEDITAFFAKDPEEISQMNLLFQTVNRTLQTFAADPKHKLRAQLGFIGVLHTWTQKLDLHYHLHCLIPAGAFDAERSRWVWPSPTTAFSTSATAT